MRAHAHLRRSAQCTLVMTANTRANQFKRRRTSQSFLFRINSGNLVLLRVNYCTHRNKFRYHLHAKLKAELKTLTIHFKLNSTPSKLFYIYRSTDSYPVHSSHTTRFQRSLQTFKIYHIFQQRRMRCFWFANQKTAFHTK